MAKLGLGQLGMARRLGMGMVGQRSQFRRLVFTKLVQQQLGRKLVVIGLIELALR